MRIILLIGWRLAMQLFFQQAEQSMYGLLLTGLTGMIGLNAGQLLTVVNTWRGGIFNALASGFFTLHNHAGQLVLRALAAPLIKDDIYSKDELEENLKRMSLTATQIEGVKKQVDIGLESMEKEVQSKVKNNLIRLRARQKQFDEERIRPVAIRSDPRIDQRTVPRKKGQQTCNMCGGIGHNRNNKRCRLSPLYKELRAEAKRNKDAGLPNQSVQQVIDLPLNQKRIKEERKKLRTKMNGFLQQRATGWAATLFGVNNVQRESTIEFEQLDMMKDCNVLKF